MLHPARFDADAEIHVEECYIPFGETSTVRLGADVTLVAVGAHVRTALAAAEMLSEDGTECEVLDLRTIVPMDTAAVIASVNLGLSQTGLAIK